MSNMKKSFANQQIKDYKKKDHCFTCNNKITSKTKATAYCAMLKCWRKKEIDRHSGNAYMCCEDHNNDQDTGWRLITPGGNPICKKCDSYSCAGHCKTCGRH